jgi:queuine tRNA-ribosyltransferase
MPVGTQATVKSLTPLNLKNVGATCLLANAYHLALRPGAELVSALGGLHNFMGWERPVLTDSGGFQVLSLAGLCETSERGARFTSHLDGRLLELTPERAVRIQELLGSDIAMPLDVCLSANASPVQVEAALDRTRRWAARSLSAHRRLEQHLFGIVQGGLDARLRREAARDLVSLGLPGYAIGGLSVGEPGPVTRMLVAATTSELPWDRPRYLMGVGSPGEVLRYTASGVDMFDSVLPTRFGRTGIALVPQGRLTLRRAEFRMDERPLDAGCDCLACQHFSRTYLHTAVRSGEHLGARLLSLHNTRMLIRTAETARSAILDGSFARLLSDVAADDRQSAGVGRELPGLRRMSPSVAAHA